MGGGGGETETRHAGVGARWPTANGDGDNTHTVLFTFWYQMVRRTGTVNDTDALDEYHKLQMRQ